MYEHLSYGKLFYRSSFVSLADTDLKRAVNGNNEFYRHLVENSLGLICAHDLDGKLLSINTEAARLLEYSPHELIGRNIRDLVDEPLRRLFEQYLHRISRRSEASGELRLKKRSGATVTWYYRNSVYREPGSAPLVIGHALDITRHLQMEEKLKESTERYRALFDDAPVAYHEINREGVIVRVNRAECQLLEWPREELLDRPVWELISSGQKALSEATVKRKLRGEQPLAPFVREYVRKDGAKLILLIHENLIQSTAGEILGIRSTLLDVTEQTRAAAELRRMNADLDARIEARTQELERSNERLNNFVHAVSHDLREPLRSISSFSSLLQRRYRDVLDEEGRSMLNQVNRSAERMAALIHDLLSYSRNSEGDFATETVNLDDALGAALQNLNEAIHASGARIESGKLPDAPANFSQMMQLFQNLVENALKYRSDAAPHIRICAEQQGGTVRITVADNGIGIPSEEREGIFTPFKRASNAGCDGTGIGLAICQSIIERHNGRIWVGETPSGGGTAFHFTLGSPSKHPALVAESVDGSQE